MEPWNARIAFGEAFDLSSNLITITAGQGSASISLKVHSSVLSRSSEFFQRILKPEWASLRDDPNTIDLFMHSASEVHTYCHFLYSGQIPTRDFDPTNDTKSDPIWIDLAHAYVFAEKMLDRRYKAAILATFAGVQREAPDFPCAEAFSIIYEGTPEGSPARLLLSDMYAYGAYDGPDWTREFDMLPHEALVDVLRAMVKVRRGNDARPWQESMEAYRERDVGLENKGGPHRVVWC